MAIKAFQDRAGYAEDPDRSRGRLRPDTPSPTRNAFRRDCDRIIHSAAFRRLAYKTQVFVFHEGDHFRNRLTHSLEVAQIARSLARALGLDEDLSEALALSHDLGHTPFGHAGERALDECLAGHGGFDHNAQALKIVTSLERRYPAFDGLNLTWETLEGLVKHNGPLVDRAGEPQPRYRDHGVPYVILRYDESHPLDLWSFASAEAQVAAISDDIAYNAHDIDDGLRAGLFGVGELAGLPLLSDIIAAIDREHPAADESRRIAEILRRLITRMIEDVIATAAARFAALGPASPDDIRRASRPVIGFSESMARAEAAIKAFLTARMYREARIWQISLDAGRVVTELFAHFRDSPDRLPPDWRADLDLADERRVLRRIADYIAGMTDRFALNEHRKLFKDTPKLR